MIKPKSVLYLSLMACFTLGSCENKGGLSGERRSDTTNFSGTTPDSTTEGYSSAGSTTSSTSGSSGGTTTITTGGTGANPGNQYVNKGSGNNVVNSTTGGYPHDPHSGGLGPQNMPGSTTSSPTATEGKATQSTSGSAASTTSGGRGMSNGASTH